MQEVTSTIHFIEVLTLTQDSCTQRGNRWILIDSPWKPKQKVDNLSVTMTTDHLRVNSGRSCFHIKSSISIVRLRTDGQWQDYLWRERTSGSSDTLIYTVVEKNNFHFRSFCEISIISCLKCIFNSNMIISKFHHNILGKLKSKVSNNFHLGETGSILGSLGPKVPNNFHFWEVGILDSTRMFFLKVQSECSLKTRLQYFLIDNIQEAGCERAWTFHSWSHSGVKKVNLGSSNEMISSAKSIKRESTFF